MMHVHFVTLHRECCAPPLGRWYSPDRVTTAGTVQGTPTTAQSRPPAAGASRGGATAGPATGAGRRGRVWRKNAAPQQCSHALCGRSGRPCGGRWAAAAEGHNSAGIVSFNLCSAALVSRSAVSGTAISACILRACVCNYTFQFVLVALMSCLHVHTLSSEHVQNCLSPSVPRSRQRQC